MLTTQSVEATVATAMPTEIIITDRYFDQWYLATQSALTNDIQQVCKVMLSLKQLLSASA